MASEWPLTPPEGYRLDDPEYEQSWYVTLFVLGWLVGAYIGTPTLIIGVHGLGIVVGIPRSHPARWLGVDDLHRRGARCHRNIRCRS